MHAVYAECEPCGWRGPLRRRYGEAVTDERRHQHAADVSDALAGLLALFGHDSSGAALWLAQAPELAKTDRGTRWALSLLSGSPRGL